MNIPIWKSKDLICEVWKPTYLSEFRSYVCSIKSTAFTNLTEY